MDCLHFGYEFHPPMDLGNQKKGWTRKNVQLRGYRKEDLIGLDIYSEREMKGGRNKCISVNRQGNENGEDRKNPGSKEW
jgi:hypothetical protein